MHVHVAILLRTKHCHACESVKLLQSTQAQSKKYRLHKETACSRKWPTGALPLRISVHIWLDKSETLVVEINDEIKKI